MKFKSSGSLKTDGITLKLTIENAKELITLVRLFNVPNQWLDKALPWLKGYGNRVPQELFYDLLNRAVKEGILTPEYKIIRSALKRRKNVG